MGKKTSVKKANEAPPNSEINDPRFDSENLNINEIYEKIAPYLVNPDFIKEFLTHNSNIAREKLIDLVEKEILKYNSTKRTDLRILLNSI